MAVWTSDELTRIGTAEELQVASVRRDGTLRNPVTVWVVRHGDDLYIRALNGRTAAWFRGAQERRPHPGWRRPEGCRRFALHIPGPHAIRMSRMDAKLVHTIYHPSLCIVAQGAKRMLLGRDVYVYDASHMLVVSVDLPVAAQVTQASHAEPFLCFRIDLDPAKIAELVLKVYPYGLPQAQEKRPIYVGPPSASIVNAATRLMELMAQPGDSDPSAP